MWISKKKWNEVCEMFDTINLRFENVATRVEELEKRTYDYEDYKIRVEHLLGAHDCEYSKCFRGIRDNNGHTIPTPIVEVKHKIEKSSTENIKNITLEELARLVIDGTPITRKVMEENVKEYGRKD